MEFDRLAVYSTGLHLKTNKADSLAETITFLCLIISCHFIRFSISCMHTQAYSSVICIKYTNIQHN